MNRPSEHVGTNNNVIRLGINWLLSINYWKDNAAIERGFAGGEQRVARRPIRTEPVSTAR